MFSLQMHLLYGMGTVVWSEREKDDEVYVIYDTKSCLRRTSFLKKEWNKIRSIKLEDKALTISRHVNSFVVLFQG